MKRPVRAPFQKGTRLATVVIAASNSDAILKASADIVCTGVNDDIKFQNAVDACSSGDSIAVLNGTYTFNPSQTPYTYTDFLMGVVITKPLEIFGVGRPIITNKSGIAPGGSTPGVASFYIDTDPTGTGAITAVKIRGLHYTGNTANITVNYNPMVFIKSGVGHEICENSCDDAKYWLYGDGYTTETTSGGYIIARNRIILSGWWGGYTLSLHNFGINSVIADNVIYKPLYGIFLDSCYGVEVHGNKIYRPNGIGIALLEDAGYCNIHGNLVDGYATGPVWGISILDSGSAEPKCSNNFIHGNILNACQNGFQVVPSGATNNIFKNNFLYNLSGTLVSDNGTGTIIKDNQGYNPVGVVTVTVPTTGVAVAAAGYDRTFYVTNGNGSANFAVGASTVLTLAASAQGTVFVPAGQTLTWTGTGTAPTWTVYGN